MMMKSQLRYLFQTRKSDCVLDHYIIIRDCGSNLYVGMGVVEVF